MLRGAWDIVKKKGIWDAPKVEHFVGLKAMMNREQKDVYIGRVLTYV